jgi:hypothetical protein
LLVSTFHRQSGYRKEHGGIAVMPAIQISFSFLNPRPVGKLKLFFGAFNQPTVALIALVFVGSLYLHAP